MVDETSATPMNPPAPPRPAGWPVLRLLGVIITVLASISTLIALWLQVREKEAHVTAEIISLQPVTRDTTWAELASTILALQTARGFDDADIWRLQARVVNDGDVTLFTTGPQQNVLTEELTIEFPGDAAVLMFGTRFEGGVLEHNMTLRAKGNTLGMIFTQWRPGEAVLLDLMLGDSTTQSRPFPVVVDRPVADGEFEIADLSSESASSSRRARAFLGIPVPIAIVVSATAAVAGVGLVIVSRTRKRAD